MADERDGFIGSHLVREQTQLVKTCCEKIQPFEKWVGASLGFYPERKSMKRSKLLSKKEATKEIG